jgi:hypothetical protein
VGALLSTITNDAPIEVAVWSDSLFFFRTFSCIEREREREREKRGKGGEEIERVGRGESVGAVCAGKWLQSGRSYQFVVFF